MLDKSLNCFAGIVLLVFAGSHFLMLAVRSPAQESLNTVFPFLADQAISLFAGILELATAAICLKYRGRNFAYLAVLTFMAVVLWYRWALAFTGAIHDCQCLGILRRALHLSKSQERFAPIIVLILLASTMLPWVFRLIARAGRRLPITFRPASTATVLVITFLSHLSYSQETVQITGYYDTSRFNSQTGKQYTDLTNHVAFTYTLSGQQWSIYSTNLATEGWTVETAWEGLVCDGTNTYTFMPDYKDWQGSNYPVRVTISPGLIFIRDYDELLDFESIWLTYGLRADNLPTDKDGIVEIPLPWYNARTSPMAYGFEWQITPSADGKFMSACQVVSKASLGLDARKELARPTVNPPGSFGEYSRFDKLRRIRATDFPDGFISASYKCTAWHKTNGLLLPAASEERRYGNYPFTNFPAYNAIVRGTAITVRAAPEHLLPAVTAKTLVADYRYRRTEGSRVLPSLEYVLDPGASWKPPNDPVLLVQAKAEFLHATDLSYTRDKRRSALTWAILAIVVLAPLVLIRVAKSRKNAGKNSNKNNK